jgi:hypothetical protein
MTVALSEGQLTLNNRWDDTERALHNITDDIHWEGLNQPAGRVRPYTTTVQEYRVRRKQCEEDFNKFYPPFDYTVPGTGVTYTVVDRKCYPTLTDEPYLVRPPINVQDVVAKEVLKRYGWYSGGGFPPVPASNTSRFREGTPEPLDGVDYCSRLHDEKVWAGNVGPGPNECGILMCLYKASGLPANVMALLPDVETARQHWYSGAASNVTPWLGACKGDQFNVAPPPVLAP